MTINRSLCMLVALSSLGIAAAQTPATAPEAGTSPAPVKAPPFRFYHLDFIVKEVDEGRVINSRTYSTTVSAEQSGRPSIRAGSKVPVALEGNGGFSYIDVGINFDCKYLGETANSLMLDVTAEVSSIATPLTGEPLPAHSPNVIRQNRWTSPVVVQLRKPATIFSSDDLTSKRKIQIELTATPVTP